MILFIRNVKHIKGTAHRNVFNVTLDFVKENSTYIFS